MPEILSIGELLDLGNSASTAGLIPYSALEYNGSGDISAISGSAIAGGVDTTIVSAIASSYVESGISSKVDQSAFDDCCSAMSSIVSSKLDASASSMFQPSGDYMDNSASAMFQPSGNYASATDLSAYVPFSGFEYSGSTITAISGSAIGGSQGFEQVQSDWTESASASASYIQHKPTTKPISAGSGIQIVEYVDNITIAGTVAPQVQSNWAENDSASASYIKNKPLVKPIVAGANISIVDAGSQLTIASLGAGGVPVQANWSQADSAQADYILNKPTGLAPQVQSNWAETSTSSKAFVLNKPTTKPIVAGAGISITENATAIIISLA